MTCSGVCLSVSNNFTTPPSSIFFWTVVPFRRCSVWERFGSIFTSHEHTVARVARPKVVRKVCLVGLGKQEGGHGVALESAAAAWQADRLMLVKQPVSRIDAGSFESASDGLSKQVEAFFAA